MDIFLILFVALAPIIILLYYICFKDRKSPEPIWQIVKAFLAGLFSAPLSFTMSIPLALIGVYPAEATNILEGISTAFFGAAIPEEIAKFFMLWLILRRNKYFDERVDGIVYAVCVSLGFAALENIIYLFSEPDLFLTTGITRAIFSVPGHFCFGILMGYYYSLAKFYHKGRRKNMILILGAPILVHGLYNSILFLINLTPTISGLLSIIFIVFNFRVWKYCGKNIEEHLKRDSRVEK